MAFEKPEDFYQTYTAFKRYETPRLKDKHVRWFDREFWVPARCSTETSVLELGSGTGEFLSYLKRKGVGRFQGVEQDAAAVAVMEPGLEKYVTVGDIWDFLESGNKDGPFGCVVLLDVLEHFSPGDGVRLLQAIKKVLVPGGRVIVRVPNMGSPWGGMHQFADLTHKTAFTPNSLEQLGQAAGYTALDFLAQRRGSPFRRLAEDCLHGLLSRILTTTPIVWTPNMIAVLEVKGGV